VTAIVWIVLSGESGLGFVLAALAAAWAQKHWRHREPQPHPPVRLRTGQCALPSATCHGSTDRRAA
jgi:hypothetical protein